MVMKYFVFFILTQLISFMVLGDSFPTRCYVRDGLDTAINCPNSNITSLPTSPPYLVYEVFLQHNRIQTTHDLSGVSFSRSLNLSHNVITSFPWESLNYMKNLHKLDLSYNQLTDIRLDLARKGTTFLYWVNVAYNRMATFSEANLDTRSLSSKKNIYRPARKGYRFVYGNPIHCDCRMSWLTEIALTFYQCWPHTCTSVVEEGLLFNDFVVNGLPKCSSPEILHDMPLHEANLTSCPTTGSGEKGTETQPPILENATDYFTISETILPPERNQSKDIRHGLPKVTHPSTKNEIGSIPNKVAFKARDAILITCAGVFILILVVAFSVATKHVIQKKLNGEHPDGPNQYEEPREIAGRSYVSPGPPNVLINPVYGMRGDYATQLSMGQSPILQTPSTNELPRRVSNNRQRTLENVLYGRNQADCQFDSGSLYTPGVFSRRITL